MRMYPFLYEYPMKSGKALGAEFLSGKAENAGGLSLAKDDNNAAWREYAARNVLF